MSIVLKNVLQIGLLALMITGCSEDETSPSSEEPVHLDASGPQPADSSRGIAADTAPPDVTLSPPDGAPVPDVHQVSPPDVGSAPDAWVATVDAAPAVADAALSDGAAVDPAANPPTCPDEAFEACGGDLVGHWQLVDFCSPEGPAGAPRQCEGPGDEQPACQGGINVSECKLRYQGTADFSDDGRLDVWFGVSMSVRYVFDDACVLTISAGTSPAEACTGMGSARLQCVYTDGRCTCIADSEPEGEGNTIDYRIDDGQVWIAGSPGRYCVEEDAATLRFDPFGPEGWQSWLLRR